MGPNERIKKILINTRILEVTLSYDVVRTVSGAQHYTVRQPDGSEIHFG